MNKQKPDKEIILQSLYDYGVESTCKQWSITEEEISNILYPKEKPAPKIRTTKNVLVVANEDISSIISKNYNKLWSKYVKDKGKLSMCQNAEDIFHNTLLKVLEESFIASEEKVLEKINYLLNTANFQTKQDQKELYKHQIYLENAYTQESPKASK